MLMRLAINPALTMQMAAIMMDMVARVIKRKIQGAQFERLLYPWIRSFPVLAGYQAPALNNEYFKMCIKIMASINSKPKAAPALVLCTKCETPMAAPAYRMPELNDLSELNFMG